MEIFCLCARCMHGIKAIGKTVRIRGIVDDAETTCDWCARPDTVLFELSLEQDPEKENP